MKVEEGALRNVSRKELIILSDSEIVEYPSSGKRANYSPSSDATFLNFDSKRCSYSNCVSSCRNFGFGSMKTMFLLFKMDMNFALLLFFFASPIHLLTDRYVHAPRAQ